jgi:hypothetical protein
MDLLYKMPFIYFKDGHYIANKNKLDGNIGIIMGDHITIFDKSHYFYSDKKKEHILMHINVVDLL